MTTDTPSTKTGVTEFFHCLSVSREDFLSIGYDGSGLSDAEMENIARDLGENDYIMIGFWEILGSIAQDLNLVHVANPDDEDEEAGWEG